MSWVKKGLIFCPDGTDEWMRSHAAIPFADCINDDTTRIYFSSRNGEGKSMPFSMDVQSGNVAEIISINSEPILGLGKLGSFDDSGIMPSCIVNSGYRKYMYYIGWNPQVTVSYRLSIGLAISDDGGKSYRKYSEGPVCDRDIYEPYFNTAPYVILENGLWRMWYISCTEWVMVNNYPEPKYHVKYCESKDGIVWKKDGTVCLDYDEKHQAIGRPSVLFENGVYKMYYSYRKLEGYRSAEDAGYRLGYAESLDGIKWSKCDNDLLVTPSDNQGDWDFQMIEYCHVFSSLGNKIMLYNGNGFGKTGIGFAVYE
ncbi:MAG: hypothetical protein EOO43_14500 [Flavobacterium sp.]|nr:MAG: hypothetical protein EOO43_14500 [Flavobacterium sp.]